MLLSRRRALEEDGHDDAVQEGLSRLKADLSTGAWDQQHADLLAQAELDLGYRVVSVELAGAFRSLTGSGWQRRASGWQLIDEIINRVNATSDAERFVAKFADFWHQPSPAQLPDLLHPDVVLVQPLAPRTVGIEAAQAQFRRFGSSLPGLTADVDHWSGHSDIVFIEFRLRATIGADVLEWPNVNRLRLRDGRGIERITYFDPLAVLPTLLRHPSIAWCWYRSRVR